MYKLDKYKTYILETVQGGGENINQAWTNAKGRDPQKRYVEGISNLESWHINK